MHSVAFFGGRTDEGPDDSRLVVDVANDFSFVQTKSRRSINPAPSAVSGVEVVWRIGHGLPEARGKDFYFAYSTRWAVRPCRQKRYLAVTKCRSLSLSIWPCWLRRNTHRQNARALHFVRTYTAPPSPAGSSDCWRVTNIANASAPSETAAMRA